jgi:hypothetical protein
MIRNLEKYFLFIFSPFLALPLVLWDTLNKSKGSLLLLTITYALISYLYIPDDADDKFYYIGLFEDFKVLDFDGFLFFIFLEATDFFYYLIFYLYAQIGFSSGFFFFSMTFFTVGISIYVFDKILQTFQLKGKRYFLFITMLLLSFNLVNLLSGFRFYLASTFVLLGLYNAFFGRKKSIGLLFLILGIVTHFSALLFLVLYLFILFFNNSQKIIKSFFIFSFIFLIVPNNLMLDMVNNIGLEGIFQKKATGYLDEEGDLVKDGIEQGNSNNLIKVISDNIWLLVVYIMLMSKKYPNDIYKNLLVISIGLIHIFFMAPDVFFRYSIVTKFFLILFLISNEWQIKFPKYSLIFLLIFTFNFILSIVALRTRFITSFSDIKSYSLITIFLE